MSKKFLKQFLALCLALTLFVSLAPRGAEAATTTTATVKGGWLRLRAAASFSAVTISSYYTGTVVTVLGTSGAWYHVLTPDNRTGYMYGSYLTIGGTSTTPTENTPATVVSGNGLGVRLRTGPSTAYGVIGLYPVGTSATILSSGKTWHYVRIGKQTGYMMSQFLSVGGSVTPPAQSYTAWITSENGLGVRLRTGAGTRYGVIGVYSVGTQVTVLKHNKTWDYIRVGSRTGYMMNKFLTTSPTSGTTLTSVTLNAQVVSAGDTLRVASISPAGATVSYQWLNDQGVVLATTATYQVRSSDAGRRICVRVTGTGGYSGTATSSYATVLTGAANTVTDITISDLSPRVGTTLVATVTPAQATVNYAWYRSNGAYLGAGRSYTVTEQDVGYQLYVIAIGANGYTGSATSGYTNVVQANTPSESPFAGSVTLPTTATTGTTLFPAVTLNINWTNYRLDYSWSVDGAVVSSNATLDVTDSMVGKSITVTVTGTSATGATGSITSNACYVISGSVATLTSMIER